MATTLIVLGCPGETTGFKDLTGQAQRLTAAKGDSILNCPTCDIQRSGTAIVATTTGSLEMRAYDKSTEAGSVGITEEVGQVVPKGALVYTFADPQAARDWYVASQPDFGLHVAYFFDNPAAPAS